MQKISQKSQNFNKISGFQKNFKIKILHHLDKQKIDITCMILKIHDLNFTCKPNFYSRKHHILASRLNDHFFIDKNMIFQINLLGAGSRATAKMLRGGLWGPPMGDRVNQFLRSRAHLLDLFIFFLAFTIMFSNIGSPTNFSIN